MLTVVRQVPHENLGLLEPWLTQAGLSFRYCDVFRPTYEPFDPRRSSGLIVLGGPMNVDEIDRYPFLAEEVQWLRAAMAAGRPVLGICLGAQLLAKSLGASVFPNRVKEIGWYDIELTSAAASDPCFQGCSPRQRVFQWHGDTFDLPAGAVQLARSETCEQQAFRAGERAWGLQFHLELTPRLMETWLCEPGNCGELDSLGYIDPAAIRQAAPREFPEVERFGQHVFSRFARLARGDGSSPGA